MRSFQLSLAINGVREEPMAKMKREDVEIPVTNELTFKEEPKVSEVQVTHSVDLTSFTEVSYGIARKKVDLGKPTERVRSYLVEVKFNPETGETLPATLIEMDNISAAIREFKIKTVKNVLKM